jgi:pentatricopeptide repeat protein
MSQDETNVLVTLTGAGQDDRERVWLQLSGRYLIAEPKRSGPSKMLAEHLSAEGPLSVPISDVQILPPGRRLSVGHLLGLIPALLFGLVAVVGTILWLTGSERDPGLAIAFGILCAVALAPALPFVIRGRATGRLQLGHDGPLLEFWYKPGSRKHRAIDAFFLRLDEVQRQAGEMAREAPLPARWNDTEWETPDLQEPVRPLTRLFRGIGAAIAALVALAAIVGQFYSPVLLFAAAALAIIAFVGFLVRQSRSKEMRMAERHWARREYDAAAEWLRKSLSKHPRSKRAWRMLVEYHVERGEWDTAFQCCDSMQAHGLKDAERVRARIARFRELNEHRRATVVNGRGPHHPRPDDSLVHRDGQ